jgi:hypothetical protein
MKNFTHSLNQAFYCLVSRTIVISLLLTGTISVAFVMNTMASPDVGKYPGIKSIRAVTFTQHPTPQAPCEGSNTTFSVVASGTGALTYQWQVSTNGGGIWNAVTNGSAYANSTTATLSVLAVTGSMNNNQYRCQVTDNSGSYYSNATLLTVNPAPGVKTGNGAAAICANGGGSISAQLFAGLTYQWQVSTNNGGTWSDLTNVSPYSGTSTDLLMISSGVSLNGNLYRYIAVNSVTGCQATSGHDTLHVLQPSITQAPVSSAICTGSNATFSVTASSTTNLIYQWHRQVPPLTALTESAPYSGTATNTLTVTGATTAMNGFRYLVSVTDTLGCVTNSALVTLNVYNPLAINTQPRDTFACANTSIANAFRVTMSSGSQPMTYQWQTDNGTNGVTWASASAAVASSSSVSTLSLASVTLSMNGYRYRVSVTGACGTIFSNEVTLRVLADGTWRGTTNTNWHTATNWCGGVPTSVTDVLIPAWAPRMPEISDATGTAFSRALHIEPAARLTISGGTTSMSGPFNIEGTVAYTANGNQPVLPAAHGSLEINGSGNKYMQSNIDISHNLVLGGNAKLDTGNYLLVMKAGSNPISGATFNGAVTSWIVTGNGNSGAANTGLGGLRIEQVDATDGNVLYPIGATAAAYNPLQLSNTGTTDHFTVAVNDQVIPGGIYQSGIDRTWLVGEAAAGGSNISLALRWADVEELALFDRTLTEVIRSDGANIVQTSATDAAAGTDPYSRSAGAFAILTQFSVASHAKVLPIPLPVFNVQAVNKTTARLNWKSDSWNEGGAFVIQKSVEGPSFTDIGVVSRVPGITTYSFTDYHLASGVSRYRIKITAPGHEAQYSKMAQVESQLFNQHVELRPSVTGKELTMLYITLSVKERLSVTLTDVMGRIQLIKSIQLDKGEHYLPLHIGNLAKGIYHVRVWGSHTTHQSLHLVKQ